MLSFSFKSLRQCYWGRYCLGIFWFCGLALGITCTTNTDIISFISDQHFAPNTSSLIAVSVPLVSAFLITVIALVVSQPSLFYLAAFSRGFILGFMLNLMFSADQYNYFLRYSIESMLCSAALLWFWHRHIAGYQPTLIRDITLCFLIHLISTLTFAHSFY